MANVYFLRKLSSNQGLRYYWQTKERTLILNFFSKVKKAEDLSCSQGNKQGWMYVEKFGAVANKRATCSDVDETSSDCQYDRKFPRWNLYVLTSRVHASWES